MPTILSVCSIPRDYLLNAQLAHPKSLRGLLRPAYFVPESVRTDVLFRDMQSKKVHMAIVVDEYGVETSRAGYNGGPGRDCGQYLR